MPDPDLSSLPQAAWPDNVPMVGVDPPSFLDTFSASYEAANRQKALNAEWANRTDWLDDRLNDYRARTGERLINPLRLGGLNPVERIAHPEATVEATLATNRQKFAAAGMPWPSDDEIVRGGIDKARAAGRQAATLAMGPQTWGAWAGRQAGGFAQSGTDPINLMSTALAPELGPGIALAAARSGLSFAGATALEGALTYRYQHEVDPNVTPGTIAGEAAMAGVTGAGMEAGGQLLWKGLGLAWRKLAATNPEAAARAPLEVHDAGVIAARAGDLEAQAPFKGGDALIAHTNGIAAVERALLEDRQPELPMAAQREVEARRGTAYYPGGKVDLKYELAEADDLLTSHDLDGRVNPAYPVELQPRDRTSAASAEQIAAMASRFEPERAAPNTNANEGPPIVGPDNVVESGNGRTAAIRRMYNQVPERADAYRNFLEQSGYDTTGYERPVLIGRRLEAMEPEARARFAQSLTGSGLKLNATETALSDARFLSKQAIADAQPGEVNSAANRDFVRGFLSEIPQEERAAFMTKGGQLSATGKRRLEAALIARAYGDADVVTRLYEHPDPNIKTIGYALRQSAIEWAQMRDAAAAGDIPAGHDITEHILSAVRAVMRARDEGRPIAEVLDQGDLFHSDLARLSARWLFKDDEMTKLASQKTIAENLAGYARESLKNTTEGRLIGAPLKPEEVARATTVAEPARPGPADLLAATGAPEPVVRNAADTADIVRGYHYRDEDAVLDSLLSKENLANPAKQAQAAEAARAELERLRDTGDNKIFDATGAPSVIDKPMALLDGMEAAAKAIRDTCNAMAAE